MEADSVSINRAPVLTLWAAVVAERLGFTPDEALSLGKVLAGLNAQTKGQMIGIYEPRKGSDGGLPRKSGLGEQFWVDLLGRSVPVKQTAAGIRAVTGDEPAEPAKVQTYLASKFGESLQAVRDAMTELACSYEPAELAACAYSLYETFRPKIESGQKGWGQKSALRLDLIRSLARRRH